MNIIGILIIWLYLAVVYVILSKWPMGKEYERRQRYWTKFEKK